MDKKIKNHLGIGALVSMVILATSSLIFANIYSKSIEPSSYRSFSVSGEGKITAIPDVARFTFSVITEG
ncbi:MAG TPA: SIMPL domain-containing protein, partial [Patescibacteria group bacterium]|nr:SIMPL domain-containing protein [Patescibacteria group bacterium]